DVNSTTEVMIRTICKPDKNKVTLNLPDKYVGKNIEIIAFSTDEGMDEKHDKAISFTVLKTTKADYTFNRDEANER
ncbi:MAG: hypothetical protein OEW75_15655, partial [Cyclobacteriaceae bacterium]|nr:hypothetical protein [Cyclobacteriaceae bacterium]